MGRLIIVGEEAFTEEEYAARERRLQSQREYDRRRRQRPERQAYMREYLRRYLPEWRARRAA